MDVQTGLMVAGATVVAIFTGAALLVSASLWLMGVRATLRRRYADDWLPQGKDLILIPAWIVLELFLFAASALITLVLLLLAYQTAKDFRNWWHRGSAG